MGTPLIMVPHKLLPLDQSKRAHHFIRHNAHRRCSHHVICFHLQAYCTGLQKVLQAIDKSSGETCRRDIIETCIVTDGSRGPRARYYRVISQRDEVYIATAGCALKAQMQVATIIDRVVQSKLQPEWQEAPTSHYQMWNLLWTWQRPKIDFV